MKLKTTLSLLALASCAALSTSAMAQSTGTIELKGFISPVSCTPKLSGGSIQGNTLSLPDAVLTDLNANGAFTGQTEFKFEATGCTTVGVDNMWVHFSGTNVDGNGRIRPTTGTQNVRFELLNGPGGAAIVAGGPVPGVVAPGANQGTAAAFSGSNPNRTASKTYAVRYRAEQALAAADVGAVTSSVTYNVIYH